MGVAQGSGYCLVCNRQSMFQKQKINHVLHFVLTLFTLGLWSLVWITLLIVNSAKPKRCASCGSTEGSGGLPQGLVNSPQAPVEQPAHAAGYPQQVQNAPPPTAAGSSGNFGAPAADPSLGQPLQPDYAPPPAASDRVEGPALGLPEEGSSGGRA